MTDLWYGTAGPRNAPIMIVGEAWGREEEAAKRPFVGESGKEYRRMLAEAGVREADIFWTNVVPERPPNNEMWRFFYPSNESPSPAMNGLHPMPNVVAGITALWEQINVLRPKVVIATGNYALWALTRACTGSAINDESFGRRVPTGIDSWRGSMWYCDGTPSCTDIKLIPILHPAGILRNWKQRPPTVHDLRVRIPAALRGDWRPRGREIVIDASFVRACDILRGWLNRADNCARKNARFRLANDIETSRMNITCMGFASDTRFAFVLPFIRLGEGRTFEPHWTPLEHETLWTLTRRLLIHPNVDVVGQNYLYDTQYIQRDAGCTPNLRFDTMHAQNVLFPGTPKGLDYLSSLYCRYHWYWKEDAKEWDLHGTLADHLQYNGEDCLRTVEVADVLVPLIASEGMQAQYDFKMAQDRLALRMMNRGLRTNDQRRADLSLELAVAASQLGTWFESILPQRLVIEALDIKSKVKWWDSTDQQRRFFAECLGFRLPRHRKTKKVTFGKEALMILSERHPEFIEVFDALKNLRSLGVFKKTFVDARKDVDGRFRCMFNVSGPETHRWSSSKNAFGSGTNMQNLPVGTEDKDD